MAHITAGDLYPIVTQTELSYGTEPSSPTGTYYGDVAEGGSFTPMDTPNPHVSYTYGSRGYDPFNYATTQKDAGFRVTLEAKDDNSSAWANIITNAINGTNRTELIQVKTSAGYRGRKYMGVMTDQLVISCDEPGGIVKYEETCLASYSKPISGLISATQLPSGHSTQWLGGAVIDNTTTIYPQSFKISFNNNLQRVRVPGSAGEGAKTGALIMGRREITCEMDIWMEDLAFMNDAMDNDRNTTDIAIVLGNQYKMKLTMQYVGWMDCNPDFVQDKQKQTIRFRCNSMTATHVS